MLDLLIEAEAWEPDLEPWAEEACGATLAHLALDPTRVEISLLGCDDARIAALNGDFRDKPTPTNVLSWPSEEITLPRGKPPALPVLHEDGPPHALGDIAIAYETCQREAAEQGKPFADHVRHLLVHGTLHLLGFDHIEDEDAALMERIEVEVLAKLGLPDPY